MELSRHELSLRDWLVILAYGLIVLVSLFGNILVCKVILFKQAMRRRVTNIFIANLTISDLMMTIFTIPMNTARQILDDWPFGEFCCKLVPFVQAISVYVSALCMTMIAIDRYQALVRPLKPRLIHKAPKWFWIAMIWTVAAMLAIPYAIFNHVVDVLAEMPISATAGPLYRCKVVYPGADQRYYKRLISCLAFATQFCIPMVIVAHCYIIIGRTISKRGCIGETTEKQAQSHLNTKRKTIKMLIFVVAMFAICWLPYNLLFLIEDFLHVNFSLTVHYVIHWLAMSSICYNPFIYFWLNKGYRQGILNILTCCCPHHRQRYHANNGSLAADETEMETLPVPHFGGAGTPGGGGCPHRQRRQDSLPHQNGGRRKPSTAVLAASSTPPPPPPTTTLHHTMIKIVPQTNQTETKPVVLPPDQDSDDDDDDDDGGDDDDDDEDDNDDHDDANHYASGGGSNGSQQWKIRFLS